MALMKSSGETASRSRWHGWLRAFRFGLAGLALLALPSLAMAAETTPGDTAGPVPSLIWALPFAIILLCIAVLPLIERAHHWWENNLNKLIVALVLALVTCLYYVLRDHGFGEAGPGWPALMAVLHHAVVGDYIPFIVLLFSLYVISGGIRLSGDIPAHPISNTTFILIGGLMASFIGTTGAAMLLIRPLLQINSERKHVKHTVIFFIFIVANIGGSLLPVGDPPLFLGYLRGVPFLWTLNLLPEFLVAMTILLITYFIYDTIQYRREDKKAITLDKTRRMPLRLEGSFNFIFLAVVVLAVALLVPEKIMPLTGWKVPSANYHLREIVMLAASGLSMLLTNKHIRQKNHFNFSAIGEVAALFIGIFITMQVPIEILQVKGASLGLDSPAHFFWATGLLSSFLDNAPTYVVFFQTAGAIPAHLADSELLHGLNTLYGHIPIRMLQAISVGSVFMGANTYIGNGPNFLVKSIAESRGVKMPSFFGYMGYSICILIPLFILIDVIFFVGLFG